MEAEEDVEVCVAQEDVRRPEVLAEVGLLPGTVRARRGARKVVVRLLQPAPAGRVGGRVRGKAVGVPHHGLRFLRFRSNAARAP